MILQQILQQTHNTELALLQTQFQMMLIEDDDIRTYIAHKSQFVSQNDGDDAATNTRLS